jgi:Fur family transcriptional regulator, peroxide stress response regulator
MDETEDRFNSMLDRLKETGHRITPQRLAILRIIAESRNHPSAEWIFEQVRTNFPTSSMATVYKTLTVLKELGEVLELEFSGDYNRYDGNRPFPHPHLICIKCKRIVDPDLNSIEEIIKKLTSETGYKIISHRMDFYGLCPDCRKRES